MPDAIDLVRVEEKVHDTVNAADKLDDTRKTADTADNLSDANKVDELLEFCSFSEDTLVTTSAGLIPIGELVVGDYVWAYNEATGHTMLYPVTAVWAHVDPVVVYLTIDGETIETTPNHPFLTQTRGWVVAGELTVGDKIRQAEGQFGTVEAIQFVAKPQAMYNLTVDEAHTYMVGPGQWVVHNDCDFWLSGDFVKIDHKTKLLDTGGPAWGAMGQYEPKGNLIKMALYDGNGDVIYHVDQPDIPSPYWHYHEFPVPGNPASGHGGTSPHPATGDLDEFMRQIGFLTDDWLSGP